MAISFRPFFVTLKEKGISQYDLIYRYGISPAQLHRIRTNSSITTNTINDLCKLLNCKLEDIMEHIPD